ncbi:MAG: LacI family transcriptional regulator [Calditrichaeota bacterium]|nr:LacI family transcriptional regulator [Calditrichota bacterium]
MRATIKDIARRVGVHPSTVSRVLTGKAEIYHIRKETIDKIEKVAKELNYRPNEIARGFRLKKTHTIGLIVPDISNPFFSRISKSIEQEAYRHNYSVILCSTNEDQKREIDSVQMLISKRIDGLILVPAQDETDHLLELKEENFPVVLVDRIFDDLETHAVITDNLGDAYKATQYLVDNGHQNIGFISGRPNIYTIKNRLEGYKKCLEDNRIPVRSQWISPGGFVLDSGYQGTREILDGKDRPTALLTSGNLITIGAIRAILEKNMRIPDDISIIAFADMHTSPYLISPLTVIAHPLERIGKEAFRLLIMAIENPKAPATVVRLATNFVTRSSVKRIES